MKMESASYSEDMRFLAEFTEAVVESARVYPGQSVTTANSLKRGCGRNSSQITLIRPGGRACYPAVWTQDFALALAEAGGSEVQALFDAEEHDFFISPLSLIEQIHLSDR